MGTSFGSSTARALLCVSSLGLVLIASGCSESDRPELGSVTGNVTMGDKPLSGVIVVFKPEVGRAATATTDEAGDYELTYSYGVEGSKVGPSTISFEWPLGEAGAPIPSKYAPGRSSLTKEVQAGDNVFDFDLDPK